MAVATKQSTGLFLPNFFAFSLKFGATCRRFELLHYIQKIKGIISDTFLVAGVGLEPTTSGL